MREAFFEIATTVELMSHYVCVISKSSWKTSKVGKFFKSFNDDCLAKSSGR